MKKILVPLTIFGAVSASAQAATIVSDFSNFSESGNLLPSANTRGQDFTSLGTSITVDWDTTGTGAGQETFLSDEFATLTVGDRISLDFAGGDFDNNNDSVGLSVSSTEAPTSRQNLVNWYWLPSSDRLQVATFDGAGNYNFERVLGITTDPDTLFIERTASGWSFGSITGGAETVHYADVTSLNGGPGGAVNITADGSALGLYSDMRSDTSFFTVSNLTVDPIPEPGSLSLLALSLGMMSVRRRQHRS